MKTRLLLAAALLFSASSFAQTTGKKNEQGAKVSTEAKSKADVGNHGETVSATATLKSEASVNRKNKSTEERAEDKPARKATRDDRKQEQKEMVAGIKSDTEVRKEERSAELKSEIEARKELLRDNKEQAHDSKERAKEARVDARSERKDAEDALLKAEVKSKSKMERKEAKADRPVKVKTGGKAGADIKLRRPQVGAKVQGSAGLGLGIL